jgi:cytochrome c biogenesis protein CcmG/thiol:disulfide interchange protein DsbE
LKNTLRWCGLILSGVALTLWVPIPDFDGDAAGQALCDPNGKVANLNFVLKDMNGRGFNLASQKGKVILLDFWATWCGPCVVEIPWFVEFQSRYGSKGLAVVGISVDDPVGKLKPYADKLKVNYPLLVGDGRNDIKERAFGPMWGLPVTFVIGRDGKICRKHVGLSAKEQFEREIKSLL